MVVDIPEPLEGHASLFLVFSGFESLETLNHDAVESVFRLLGQRAAEDIKDIATNPNDSELRKTVNEKKCIIIEVPIVKEAIGG